MSDHYDLEYFHINEDGSIAILVDSLALNTVEVSLAKHNIEVVERNEAIFLKESMVYELVLRASRDDISFAIASGTKSLRPFPPDYQHRR